MKKNGDLPLPVSLRLKKSVLVLAMLVLSRQIVQAQIVQEGALEKAIRQNPTSSLQRDWRGDYYLIRKEYDKAEREFLTALALKPSDPYARMKLGMVHEIMGKPEQARQDYVEAVKWVSYPIQFRIAQCDHQLGEEKKAIQLFRELEKVRNSASLHYAMAFCQAGLKHYELAEKELEYALGTDPQFVAGRAFFSNREEAGNLINGWKESRKRRLLIALFAALGGLTAWALWSMRKVLFWKAAPLEFEEEF